MPECRCQTEAADYGNNADAGIIFSRHSGIYLLQQMSPVFPHPLTVQQEALQWVALPRIESNPSLLYSKPLHYQPSYVTLLK
jgi:hypothetical protein